MGHVLLDYMGHNGSVVGGTCVVRQYGEHRDSGRWDMCWWTIWGTMGEWQVGHVLVDNMGHIGTVAGG